MMMHIGTYYILLKECKICILFDDLSHIQLNLNLYALRAGFLVNRSILQIFYQLIRR